MPEIQLAETTIYYEIHGQGPPLVMIRGLGGNADHWYAQIPAFEKEFTVITFDNRGMGRSRYSGGEFTILKMAEDTIGLMDALQLEKAHVMGLSMGGMIAQELAATFPERVRSLVLVATHCGGTQKADPDPRVVEVLKNMIYVASDEAKKEAASILFAPETLEQRPELAEEFTAASLRYPAGKEILIEQWHAVGKHDVHDRLGNITAPTLVLTGDVDVLVPVENAKIIADRIPGARHLIIPGGGHQILNEQAEACNRVILDFISNY